MNRSNINILIWLVLVIELYDTLLQITKKDTRKDTRKEM